MRGIEKDTDPDTEQIKNEQTCHGEPNYSTRLPGPKASRMLMDSGLPGTLAFF
jgi:hypothetical protein